MTLRQTAVCKRCPAFEHDAGLERTVREYILSLPDELRVSDEEYARRLQVCRDCGSLVNGMCALCGCFVEVRAAKRLNNCAKGKEAW